VVFYIVSATLCIIQICLLCYQRNAIARVRAIQLDLQKFDWKTLMALEGDVIALKTMLQKVNGRISGMSNSKYDLADEIRKLSPQPTNEFLDG
jgi:hypothetical protein